MPFSLISRIESLLNAIFQPAPEVMLCMSGPRCRIVIGRERQVDVLGSKITGNSTHQIPPY